MRAFNFGSLKTMSLPATNNEDKGMDLQRQKEVDESMKNEATDRVVELANAIAGGEVSEFSPWLEIAAIALEQSSQSAKDLIVMAFDNDNGKD